MDAGALSIPPQFLSISVVDPVLASWSWDQSESPVLQDFVHLIRQFDSALTWAGMKSP